MKTTTFVSIILFWALLSPLLAVGQEEQPPCAGLIGIDAQFEGGWLAVRVDVPEGQALAGFEWYNNDSQITFPALVVGTGYGSGPGSVLEMAELHSAFSGLSADWSELLFLEPVAASERTLYIVFQFPEGTHYSSLGAGGGPAIGYWSNDTGTPGWISGDGESWLRLSPRYSFAVVPEFVAADGSMLVKAGPSAGGQETPEVLKTFFTAGPNPFNPKTQLSFGLVRSQNVSLEIYDLRGYKVRTLVSGFLQAGPHSVAWLGRDDQGRAMASGVYFGRLHGSDVDLKKRLVLLK